MSMPEETRRPTHRLDPRSPLVLDTRELGRRPGSMRTLSRSVPAPADLGVDLLGVPEGSTLELDLRLESVVEGVLVSGTVPAPSTGECVRCLDPVSGHARGRPPGAVRLRGAASADEDDDDDELRRARGRPARPRAGAAGRGGAGTAAPAAVPGRLPGSVPRVRGALADDPEHGHDVADPRWAALQGRSSRRRPARPARSDPATSRPRQHHR